jgi:hypothetical protein
MRKRFEQQLTLGIKPISETQVLLICRDDVPALVISLLKIYNTPKYNKIIFITKTAYPKNLSLYFFDEKLMAFYGFIFNVYLDSL